MINKERLQQLIEQKAEIVRQYYDEWDDCVRVKTIKLNPNTNYIQTLHYEEFEDMYNLIGKDETGDFSEGFLDEFFETEEDLEEYNDFGSIVRETKLDLPFWNELKEKIDTGSFGFQDIKSFDNVKLRYKKELDGEVTIFVDKGKKTIFAENFTRKNYNKARKVCEKLFLKRR